MIASDEMATLIDDVYDVGRDFLKLHFEYGKEIPLSVFRGKALKRLRELLEVGENIYRAAYNEEVVRR